MCICYNHCNSHHMSVCHMLYTCSHHLWKVMISCLCLCKVCLSCSLPLSLMLKEYCLFFSNAHKHSFIQAWSNGLAIATQMVRIYWKTFLGSTVTCNVIMFIARILTCADQMRLGGKTFSIYGLKLRRWICLPGQGYRFPCQQSKAKHVQKQTRPYLDARVFCCIHH